MIAKKRAYKLTAPVIREPILHKQIADTLRIELAPPGRISKEGVCWYSVDIAAYSGSAPGIRTSRGIVAGIPDVIVLYRGQAHFLEIKAEDGLLSPAQQNVGVAILMAGARYAVARTASEALALLDQWDIPRAHRIRG